MPKNITSLSCAAVDSIQLVRSQFNSIQTIEQFLVRKFPNLCFLHYLQNDGANAEIPIINYLHTVVVEKRQAVWLSIPFTQCLLVHLRITAENLNLLSLYISKSPNN